MKQFDIVIIGGGVVGAAIARELSRYQLKIALLEKEAECAFGVSKSNSGIIHPGTQNPPDSLKGQLCVQGNKLIRKLAVELGVHFAEVGELIVAFNDEEIQALQQMKIEGEKLGVPGLQIVDKVWLAQHEPNLNSAVQAALYAPTAGIISPYRLTYDLMENACANGVELYTEHKVKAIRKLKDNFIIESTKTFQAKYVINAAGLWADEIAGMVGLFDFQIKARKGEEYLLDKKRANLTRHIIFPVPNKSSKGILVIKTSDGNPMIGPTAQEVIDKNDLTTTGEGLENVLTNVKKLVPSIETRDIIAYFSGLRPTAGKDFIIRHEDTVPGMVTVAGIQSPGLTASPAIALLVVKILKANGLKLPKKTKFQKHRPATPHLFAAGKNIQKLIDTDPAYGDIVCRCEMVSAKEIREAIRRGARTLDGIKFRTRAQSGRCHGGFCTTRIMKIMADELGLPLTAITKRGRGSEIVLGQREQKDA